MTDPIADAIIRIKNAFMARGEEVSMPHSKIKQAIAEILVREGYLESTDVVQNGIQTNLVVRLKYINNMPAVTDVRRVSKPGRRVYASVQEIPKTLGGYGLTILSTNKGVMTGAEARQANVGGEVLCQIW